MRISPDQAVQLARPMHLARSCDVVEQEWIRQGCGHLKVGGLGAEVGAIAGLFMVSDDHAFLHWRDRSLRLLRGIPVQRVAQSFFCKPGNEGTDRNLTCHESDKGLNVYPIATPVASHCLPACGVAWSDLMAGHKSRLTLCSVGDGSTRQGEFLEALAFAIEKTLRILFVVVDNTFAISTRTSGKKASDLGLVPEERLRQADGWNIPATIDAYMLAIERVRRGEGPLVLNVRSPRLGSHTSNDDESIYRSNAELEDARRRDPLAAFDLWLIENSFLSESELGGIRRECENYVTEVYAQVAEMNDLADPYANIQDRVQPTAVIRDAQSTRVRDSVNEALDRLLANNPNAILFGEDIEDPIGGVFRLTTSLSSKYPRQVHNSPLAEATILGVAGGLAMAGRTTIAEIQFIDFLAPGWNQLVTNLATLKWRTRGEWNCPLIMYAPVDGYCPGEGMWHSQVNASQLVRQEGLTVLMPTNPVDVHRAFQWAADNPDPTFILIPKALLWKRFEISVLKTLQASSEAHTRTRQLTYGNLSTVVTWGYPIQVVQDVLEADAQFGIELFELWSLQPMDLAGIIRSCERTRRLLVIDPEHDGPSLANMIAAKIAEKVPALQLRTLHRKHQHLGTSAKSEDETLTCRLSIELKLRELFR